jgi:AcrR family transcriptional regulator
MNKRVDLGLETRRGIIETATRMFATVGYEATSIEALLEALKISRGALYHHFRSKDAVFEAVLEAVEEKLASDIVAAGRSIGDPVKALRAGCEAWLRLAQDPVIRQIVLIDAPAVVGWEKWREIDARYGFGLLKASLESVAGGGRVKKDQMGMLAHLLLAALIEAALLIARAQNPAAAMRTARVAVNKLVDGIIV